jgi:hypothetical protein
MSVVGHKASERLKERYAVLRTMKHPEVLRATVGEDFLEDAIDGTLSWWERR